VGVQCTLTTDGRGAKKSNGKKRQDRHPIQQSTQWRGPQHIVIQMPIVQIRKTSELRDTRLRQYAPQRLRFVRTLQTDSERDSAAARDWRQPVRKNTMSVMDYEASSTTTTKARKPKETNHRHSHGHPSCSHSCSHSHSQSHSHGRSRAQGDTKGHDPTRGSVDTAVERLPPEQRPPRVVVKRVPAIAERIDLALHEVSIYLSMTPHPHIVQLLGYALPRETGELFLIYEYVPGQDLFDATDKQLDRPLAIVMLRQICSALAHCHRHGVVHCDLKPENVLVQRGEGGCRSHRDPAAVVVKLADFDGSCFAGSPDSAHTRWTAWFSAPEFLRRIALRKKPRARDKKSGSVFHPALDSWSLGMLGHELLTGHFPHRAPDNADHRSKRVQRRLLADLTDKGIQWAPEVPRDVRQFLQPLLHMDPGRRPSCEATVVHPFLNPPAPVGAATAPAVTTTAPAVSSPVSPSPAACKPRE